MPFRTSFALALLLPIVAPLAIQAYEAGDFVVVTNNELGLRTGEAEFTDTELGEVLPVREVAGNSLLVGEGSRQGHILPADVVPLANALDHFTDRIAGDEKNAELFAARSRALSFLQRHDEAAEDLSAAIELEPENADWYLGRGVERSYAGVYDLAIEDLQHALELDADNGRIYYELAEAYRYSGETDLAIQIYSQGIERGDFLPLLYCGRAWGRYEQGNSAAAMEDFDQALEHDPQDLESLYGAAWVLSTSTRADLRDGPRAVELATQLLELAGETFPEDYDLLAVAQAEAGDFEAAVEAEQQAIESEADEYMLEEYRDRLELFEQGEPYRDALPDFGDEVWDREDYVEPDPDDSIELIPPATDDSVNPLD